MISFFIGLLIGFLMCIPVGPINIWVMNTYLKYGEGKALFIALGGSLMDFIYFYVILTGLSFIDLNDKTIFVFKALGIALIIILGIKELLAKKISNIQLDETKLNHLKSQLMTNYFSFLLLGIVLYTANPTLVITMSGLGAFIKSLNFFELTSENIFGISVGVSLGSFIWFYFLIQVVKKFEDAIRNKYLHIFTLICGLLMIGLGSIMGGRLVWSFL